MELKNTFYHGDCLFVLTHDILPESIDLIYLDPPFFTGKIQKGIQKWQPGAMEVSFEDSKRFWAEKADTMREKAPEWMKHVALRRPDFASYLYYMMELLQACYNVLSKKGSIYLHCDYRASHYLKMIMDEPELFGDGNFRNEIVWCRELGGRISKANYGRHHDTILFYTKGKTYTFNWESIAEKWSSVGESKFRYEDEKGKYRLMGRFLKDSPIKGHRDVSPEWERTHPELVYRHYMKQGKMPVDYWLIPAINQASKERMGYPTQKPEVLLEKIIKASSNEGNLVLDPFCGCGTAIIVAHKLNRRWIGIDINKSAYEVTKGREVQMPLGMQQEFANAKYISRDISEVLEMNPKQFEDWVNEFYKANKPSPDKGVDGITPEGVPIQVKTFEVGYKEISQLVTDAKYHPQTVKPIKKVIVVSQIGFDDRARQRKFEIETAEKIEVCLITPEDMLKLEHTELSTIS